MQFVRDACFALWVFLSRWREEGGEGCFSGGHLARDGFRTFCALWCARSLVMVVLQVFDGVQSDS